MKRILAFAAASILLFASTLQAQDVVRITTFEFAPYVRNDEGKAKGISVDIVSEAFARMKQPVAIEIYPPARAIKMYENREVDGLFTMKKTPERKLTVLFPSKPLIVQDFVFFVRKGSGIAFAGDLAMLSDKRIGVVTGLTYGDKFNQAAKSGAVKTDPAVTLEQSFKKLLVGRVDMVVSSRFVGMDTLMRMHATDQIEVGGPPIDRLPSYLVLQIGKHETLAHRFDQVLDGMQKDGTITRILRAYGLDS